MVASPQGRDARPEQLLGPLNDVERRNAPPTLFYAGHPELLRSTRVAVVGSRTPSAESERRASQLARDLAEHDIVVVSGLARGIDSAAHRAAIKAGGRTIAVIGTPLDRVYPAENAELQEQIAREHLVVSQFPTGYPTQKGNFPRRNRTMALICHASVIVEAGDSSGTLSQGWEALRLGRTLFIMSSVLQRKELKWPSEMLSYGAHELTKIEDILPCLPAGGELASAAAF